MIFLRGLPSKDFLNKALKKKMSDTDTEKVLQEKGEYTTKLVSELPKNKLFYKGLIPFLNDLINMRAPITIATSATVDMMKYYFSKMYLSRWFDFNKIIVNDGTYPGKPNPEVFIRASNIIKLPPQKCIVFEDAISGVIAAYQAGISNIIAVGRELQLKEIRRQPGVSYTIHDFGEINLRMLLNEFKVG
jgi:HAD superfamily hydrolase (TIGR01509 family)